MLLKNARVLNASDGRFYPSDVSVKGDRILSVGKNLSSTDGETLDLAGRYLVPGLVDVHTHGRAGYDFNYASGEQMQAMAASYLSSGVTTLFPTLASNTLPEIRRAAEQIVSLKGKTQGARFAGVHLEGCFLNPRRRGSHAPELLLPPTPEALGEVLPSFGLPCHITVAEELDEGHAFLKKALDYGATVGIGHTDATYEEAMEAVAAGVTSFTHTFNAMPPMHHRQGGAIAAALTSGQFAEFICDGIHVSQPMIDLAYRLVGKDRFVLITDSMAGTDAPDGEYVIGGLTVYVREGRSLCADGTIAGSTLTLFTGVKNLMQFAKVSLGDALLCATRNPARMTGIYDEVGSVEAGKAADLLVLSGDGSDLKIDGILSGGEWFRRP